MCSTIIIRPDAVTAFLIENMAKPLSSLVLLSHIGKDKEKVVMGCREGLKIFGLGGKTQPSGTFMAGTELIGGQGEKCEHVGI